MSDRIVRKIIVAYDAAKRVKGFKLFDDNNKILSQTGRFEKNLNYNQSLFSKDPFGFGVTPVETPPPFETKEILLEAADRIVGLKAQLDDAANLTNLVIVVSRRTV
jgi:hypothetical protein